MRLRFSVIASLLGLVLPALAQPAAAPPQKRPNIVLIMADDMGYSDIGCFGGEVQTPNLDRLAAGGVRVTQFYNTSRCCPTRAALLTGLYSHQAGVGDMVGDFGTPGYRGFLNDSCATIAEVLRPAGYHTLMAGKWHVGGKPGHWPRDRGFERYWGLVDGGGNYWTVDPTRTLVDEETVIPHDGRSWYLTDEFADHAVKYVDEYGRKPEPFFLYLAFTAPHWPLHAPRDAIARYRGKYKIGWDALRRQRHQRMIDLGIVDAKWGLSPRGDKIPAWDELSEEKKDFFDLKMSVYAAQIDKMDQGIGRVLAKLRELGIEKDTLVMFLSDNGGCHEEIQRGQAGAEIGTRESFTSYGVNWANASNTPFRMYKHWVHEGGISTPLIAYWPGVIRGGWIDTRTVGHVIDLSATCYDAAGADYPKERNGKAITPLEGKSLLPAFKTGQRDGHDAIYWEHENSKAVRQGPWKLVSKPGGKWELYNLAADRTELKDLSEAEPVRVEEMKALWQAWAKRCGVLDKGKKK